MSKSQMEQARRLIQEKQYDDARAILLSIDNPRARQWLAQLDDKYPARRRRNPLASLLGFLLTIIVSALLTSGLIGVMIVISTPLRAEQGVLRITETAVAIAEANATATDTPIPDATLIPAQVNSTSNVNVRSAPDINSAAIAALVPGTTVEILDRNEDGSWYQVRLNSGQEGWLAASLVTVQGEVPTAIAQVPTGTPTPEIVCTQQVAQSWYDANRQALNLIDFLWNQLDGARASGDSFDYVAARNTLRQQRDVIQASETPDCIASIRDQVLAAIQSFDNGLNNQINGFPNEARSEWNIANAGFAMVDSHLEDEYNVSTTLNPCGAEVWYTGIADLINEYLMLTGGVTFDTGPSQEIRDRIFRLQELRREIDVALPDCTVQAAVHLFGSVDASITFFQAVMSSDTANKQAQFNTMVRERDAFFVEMNRLSVPVIIQ